MNSDLTKQFVLSFFMCLGRRVWKGGEEHDDRCDRCEKKREESCTV
jgi:hypothetical protein